MMTTGIGDTGTMAGATIIGVTTMAAAAIGVAASGSGSDRKPTPQARLRQGSSASLSLFLRRDSAAGRITDIAPRHARGKLQDQFLQLDFVDGSGSFRRWTPAPLAFVPFCPAFSLLRDA